MTCVRQCECNITSGVDHDTQILPAIDNLATDPTGGTYSQWLK